ncbi:TIGR04104 family putative zinc finger protein [Sporosarcina sp. YIM B06819]|uniref:TIGR04104 family putative zinc finger protein n=1 Tax=Sporosarcina sp. YIM B06819 TaxID=3081769 RepID=UPI0039935C3E
MVKAIKESGGLINLKLQKCNHCNAQFTRGEINKSLWLAYRPIVCTQCGTKHKVLIASRLLSVVVTVPFALLGIYLVNNYNQSLLSVLSIIIPLTLLASVISPYLVRYSDDY